MRSRSFVTVALLCVLLGYASMVQPQIVSNGMPPVPAQLRTISGVVINSVSGRPIPRALVQFGQHAVLTDGEGQFEFRDVTDNSVLFATKPGYFPENPGAGILSSLSSAGKAGPVELRLVPEAILSGQVTDAGGDPLQGISVMLRTLVASNGLRHWEQRAGTTTNAEGEFRFAELQAGEYAIQTAIKLDGPPEGDAAAGYQPLDYPALGANGAGALTVHAGDQLQADMSTRLERLYLVSGVLIGLPENAWPSLSVRTAGGLEVNSALRQNPQTGEFRVLLPSGSFELRAQAFVPPPANASNEPNSNGPRLTGINGLQLLARQVVTVAQGPVTGVKLTLEPMATIPIEVAEEKTARSNASDPPPAQMYLSLLPAEADAPPSVYPAESVGDRRFRAHDIQRVGPLLIRNVPPGRYFLQTPAQPPWYVASAFCGGTDLSRESLAITGSAAGCTIRIVLRDDGASLKVSVSDAREGRAVPAFIYAMPLDSQTRDVRMFPTGTDGKASLEAMAPGQYLLLASQRQVEQLAFRDAESLRRYETEGKRVELTPGASAEVQLDALAGEP